MLRRLGIRGKVLAALAVPVLVLFVAASLISWQSIETARVSRSVGELVGTADELSGLARAMQTERLVALAFIDSPAAAASRVEPARASTDDAAARFDAAVAVIDVRPLDSRVSDSLDLTATARASLTALRAELDATTLSRVAADSRYTAIIGLHVEEAVVFSDALSDRELARYMAAYGLVGVAEEGLVHELPNAMRVLRDGGENVRATLELASAVTLDTAAYEAAREAVTLLRLDTQLPLLDAGYYSQRLQLSSGDVNELVTVDPGSYEKQSTTALEEIAAVSDEVARQGVELATSTQAAAVRETTLTIGVTLATLAVSLMLALLIARQVVVPMRRLTQAADVVRVQLPTLVEQVAVPGAAPELALVQIPVTSRDEIGRLATAFNEVNETTIRVAQEQAALRGSIAEMFVNVARRDQVLLNRQISFIDALERSEEDPSTLANLFRLDHLATRMRRNAESLLVLAGIDSGRRVRDAMPLSDVVRTASSEIELYDRVELNLGTDPNMIGFSALPAAHLLAELLENATMFSEPDTRVEVETLAEGADYRVVVRDRGIGMSDSELEAANERIRRTTASDAVGAQRLGFYVVGRIATRLGASVTLQRGADGTGTDAVVLFPASVFEETALGASDGPAHGANRPAPAETDATDVVPIDLAAMTDGETPVGLPRRRSREESAAATAEATAGAAPGPTSDSAPDAAAEATSSGVDEGRMVLGLRSELTLSPELSARGQWAPAVPAASASSADALPTRTAPADAVPGAEVPGAAVPGAAVPARPARAGLFAGFRGRVVDAAPSSDVPVPPRHTRTSDAEPTGSVVQAWPAAAEFTIPELAADDEEWAPETRFEPLTARHSASHLAAADSPSFAAEPATGDVVPPLDEGDAVGEPPAATGDADATAARQPFVPASFVPASFVPTEFESTLDEARAWGAVEPAVPVVTSWEPIPAEDPLRPASDAPDPDEPQLASAPDRPVAGDRPVPARDEPSLSGDLELAEQDATTVETVAVDFDAAGAATEPAPQSIETGPAAQIAPSRAGRRGLFGWLRRNPRTVEVAGDRTGPPAAPADAVQGADALRDDPSADAEAATSADVSAADWSAAHDRSERTEPVEAPVSGWTPQVEHFAPRPSTPAGASQHASGGPALPSTGVPAWALLAPPTPYAPEPAPAQTASAAQDVSMVDLELGSPTEPKWAEPARRGDDLPAEPLASRHGPMTPPVERARRGPGTDSTSGWLPTPARTSTSAARSATSGVLDEQVAAMLALRSDIQEQALAEFSQLSTYRPHATSSGGGGSGGTLQRRVPGTVPVAPPIALPGHDQAIARDAEQLRSRLSSFQSGTDRGRRAAAVPLDGDGSLTDVDDLHRVDGPHPIDSLLPTESLLPVARTASFDVPQEER